MKQKHRRYGYIVLILIVAFFIAVSVFFPELKKLSSPAFIKEFLFGFGIWSYPLFILLLLLTIPLPLPSTPIALAGGYLYGTALGTLLALIATIIGSSISFYLVRTYGQPLLERLADKHHIKHFNHVFKRRGIIAALISYTVPIFPSDCVSAILGLTKIKYKTFIFIVLLGHIPRFLIVNYLGENLFAGFTWKTAAILAGGVIFIIIAAFRENLKQFFFKELKELKKETKNIEKEAKRIEEKVEKKAGIIEKDILEKRKVIIKKIINKKKKQVKTEIK